MTPHLPDAPATTASPLRAWLELVRLSVRRQAKMRQMVWIAAALLLLAVTFVSLVTYFGTWELTNRRPGPRSRTYSQQLERLVLRRALVARVEPAAALHDAIIASIGAALQHSSFLVFSRWVVFPIYLSFLLPMWTLSFATDAIGRERENRSLLWLLSRPLPRPAVFLAKYVGCLPWCLGLNLGGFAAICLAAGAPGRQALALFWPAVVVGTLAFAALFHLFAVTFRRPAVVGLVYSFFFEVLVGDLPGDLKRLSLSFYIRSIMFHATDALGLSPDQLSVYAPVDSWIAWAILIGVTAVLLGIGAVVFSRTEYGEDA